jgi:hypothetical protein
VRELIGLPALALVVASIPLLAVVIGWGLTRERERDPFWGPIVYAMQVIWAVLVMVGWAVFWFVSR